MLEMKNNTLVLSEVSRSHSKPETSSKKKKKKREASQKDEGLNVRMVKQTGNLWLRRVTTETHKRTALREDKPEAESKT